MAPVHRARVRAHWDREPEQDTADTAPAENLLPEMYADATRSGLTATVTEGANTHDLKLVDE